MAQRPVPFRIHGNRAAGHGADHLVWTFTMCCSMGIILVFGLKVMALVPVTIGRGDTEEASGSQRDRIAGKRPRVLHVQQGLGDANRFRSVMIHALRVNVKMGFDHVRECFRGIFVAS